MPELSRWKWQYAPDDSLNAYYERTAEGYDAEHVSPDDEHYESLQYIALYLRGLEITSILDTGCGTGRGVRFFREHFPGVNTVGNDPSAALLRVAVERHGIPEEQLICGDTPSLPFPPGSFDVVTSFGVLHHAPEPGKIVDRMIELASKAVFISDSNYLGQGMLLARVMKALATRAGMWPMLKFVQQGFKGWAYSEGDGVHYSYSVFNDLERVESRCQRVWVVPVGKRKAGAAANPQLSAQSVLLCGIK